MNDTTENVITLPPDIDSNSLDSDLEDENQIGWRFIAEQYQFSTGDNNRIEVEQPMIIRKRRHGSDSESSDEEFLTLKELNLTVRKMFDTDS